MKIGEVIRKIRKEKKATLEEIAFAAGTDAANLSRIERGKQNVTPEMLLSIANAMKVSVSSLYLIAEQTALPYGVENGQSIEASKLSNEQLENMVGKFLLLSIDNQKLVNDFIDLILRSQQKSSED